MTKFGYSKYEIIPPDEISSPIKFECIKKKLGNLCMLDDNFEMVSGKIKQNEPETKLSL